jgi:8-oxo-dGTP pyrophosphatase MutT (NUDIX family)
MNAWDALEPPAMIAGLRTALSGPLPGRRGHRLMAHRLAYGRHQGPVPESARKAAVLVAVHPADRGWSVPAILRPETMRSHAGQVSLPGGLIEADETPAQTALREFEEELGAATQLMHIVGRLSPVYVFVSGFEITPLVAVSPEALEFHPNSHEVAAMVEIPLSQLFDPAVRGEHTLERYGLTFTVPHFAIGGQRIWGATSLILAEFLAVLEKTSPNLLAICSRV